MSLGACRSARERRANVPWSAEPAVATIAVTVVASVLAIAALLAINTRLTNRLKRANRTMRESLEQLRMTERVARIGRWRYYPQSGRQDWSREMFLINGLDPGLGPDPGNLRPLLPDGGDELFGQLAHHARDRAPYGFEYRIRTGQGEERIL